MSGAGLIAGAERLAALGFVPVPMIAAAKRPALRGWLDAAADPGRALAAVRAATWADGLAIATGGGVLVLDVDRGHAPGVDGAQTLAGLEALHGPLPDGPRSSTPRGGSHLFFATPPGKLMRSRAAIAPGLDVRAEAGLAMCPPSPGRRWLAPLVAAAELPLAPQWLLTLAAPPRPPPRPAGPVRAWGGEVSAYARAALEGEVDRVASAPPGQRNARLFRAAASLGALVAAGALHGEEVAARLLAAACACGLVADDGEGAVRSTLASGLGAGLSSPRNVPQGRRAYAS